MAHINKAYLGIVVLFVVLALSSCHSTNDDYYSTATFAFQGDNISIEVMQGTLTLRNTSNGQEYSSADISNGIVSMSLLRGVYTLSAEGTLIYDTSDGTRHTANFRSANDYIQILDAEATIPVNVIIINQ